MLGLGSWDPEVPKGGARYTICLEETPQTDLTPLDAAGGLFRKAIGASDWLCFETKLGEEYPGRFWKDDPYRLMGPLGFRLHGGPAGDYSLGLHIEAYPPEFGFGPGPNKDMEFWITVEKA